MRRIALLTIPLLLIPSLFAATAGRQQPVQNTLPDPADYPPAGPNCGRRVNMSPWIGTPAVDWPNTFQCVLKVHTCDGVKTYTSAVRAAGTGMCDDYWKVHDELANREICCDPGSREEKRPPEEKRPSESKCEPAIPWFEDLPGCRESKSPQLVISRGAATLYMCGYAVFRYTDNNLNDKLFAEAYKAAMKDWLQTLGSFSVCCDKFKNAVRTGKPCDPRADLDCDGRPNNADLDSGMPDIDTFTRPDDAAIDPYPAYFPSRGPDYFPNRAARASKGVGDCPCKWELVKGELKCSPDGKQDHHYKATWRCSKTGAEVITFTRQSATSPCGK